ncbi:20981_t:CDS:1, partial [Racocetra persica]
EYKQILSCHKSEDFESISLPLDESEISKAFLTCASKSNIVYT